MAQIKIDIHSHTLLNAFTPEAVLVVMFTLFDRFHSGAAALHATVLLAPLFEVSAIKL